MIRIGLSVYLMLVTLAGPWLCCCQLPRLSAQFMALMQSSKMEAPGGNHSCCQHHAPAKKSEQPVHPGVPSCPCRGTHAEAPALVLLESEGARQLDRDLNSQAVDLLDGASLSGTVVPSFTLMLTSPTLSSPVLTGRDILSSLHILRC